MKKRVLVNLSNKSKVVPSMKNAVLSIGLIGCTLVLISCQSQVVDTLTITHYSLTNESVKLVQGTPSQQPISILVSYEITDENNEASNVILANGQLVDGELNLTQGVTEPTEVLISVIQGSRLVNPGITAVLKPDSEIEFVVIHSVSSYLDRYWALLKGEDHRSLHENQRFTIKGDLSQLHYFDSKLLQVSVHTEPSVVDGSDDTRQFGPVFVDEDEFSVDGDLEEPTLFTISISLGARSLHRTAVLHAILEPGVNYRVVPWGNQGKFAVVADRDSLQTKLMSNWQFEPEIVALVDTWGDSRRDASLGMESPDKDVYDEEQIRKFQVAEQCDHARLTNDVKSKFIERFKYSYERAADLIVKSWSKSLRQNLQDTQNPELARMIFELSWRQLRDDEIIRAAETDDKLAILKELASILDEKFVAEFITPQIEALVEKERADMRISLLRPGQVAPKFTLTTITGEEVSLGEVLNENELVLLVFWASWCDWCTRSFSELKQLYRRYNDQGFEIVTVSLDDTAEEWETTSKEMKLPWVDLGDSNENKMKNNSSLTADAYEVRLKPDHSYVYGGYFIVSSQIISSNENRFLIDQDGCILN